MLKEVKPGDCVKIPDGRIGRVRGIGNLYKIRILRKTGFNPKEKDSKYYLYYPNIICVGQKSNSCS